MIPKLGDGVPISEVQSRRFTAPRYNPLADDEDESIELILRLKQIGIDYLQGHAIHNPAPLSRLEAPPLGDPTDGNRAFHGFSD